MNAIEIEQLKVTFGTDGVLECTGVTIERGEIVAIVGPSGCGKSTLLRAIAKLDAHPGACVRTHGEIGYVCAEPRLFPWLTVERNVLSAARSQEEHARIHTVLELTGLESARGMLPKALSGGMAQRAALARALVRNPSILLLDEPLAALDALRRMLLQETLARIIAAVQATAVIVTHDIEEALFLSDRIIVLGGTPVCVKESIEIPRACRRNRGANLAAQRDALVHALSGTTAVSLVERPAG